MAISAISSPEKPELRHGSTRGSRSQCGLRSATWTLHFDEPVNCPDCLKIHTGPAYVGYCPECDVRVHHAYAAPHPHEPGRLIHTRIVTVRNNFGPVATGPCNTRLEPLANRKPKPPTYEILKCPHCGLQHIDRNKPDFAYAEKNHPRHLCEKADGGCGRFFYTRPNIGVAQLPGESP